MQAKLYVIPGSHPSMTGRLMLEYKGISYKRVDLIPAVHRLVLLMKRFPGKTVPALSIDGGKIQGTREISQFLDVLKPQPPLFPTDQVLSAQVREAELWGDQVLQPIPRRLTWWCFRRDRSTMLGFSQGANLGVPVGLAVKTGAPIVHLQARLNGSTDSAVKKDLADLPGHLDKIDSWIEQGVLDGDDLNAADFQIATSLRLLLCIDDLLPLIENRPAGGLARRVAPDYPGRIGKLFPEDWLLT